MNKKLIFTMTGLLLVSHPLVLFSQESNDCLSSFDKLVENSSIRIGQVYVEVDKSLNKVLNKGETKLSEDVAKAFLRKLLPHANMKSTTSFRVEEKVVISEEALEEFFQKTQVEIVKADGNKVTVKWSARDEKIPGKETKTITEYGKSIKFKSSVSDTPIGFRPRFRKYFTYNSDGTLKDQAESVFGELTAFELKISNMGGFKKKVSSLEAEESNLVPIIKEGAVFKPRVFIPNEIADQLKELDATDADYLTKLEDIKSAMLMVPDLKDKKEKVISMIEAVKMVLKKQPKLFIPSTVVAYNRDSYKFLDDVYEYQFTVDRNIKIYRPVTGRSTDKMNQYMSDVPEYDMQSNDVFAELKTPIPVHDNADSEFVYKKIISEMRKNHNEEYSLGKGKYFLGKDNKPSEQNSINGVVNINEVGPLYWLVRNTGNLLGAPKVKDVVERSTFKVAIPVENGTNDPYRVTLTYGPVNNLDGQIAAVVKDIKVFDGNGLVVEDSGLGKDLVKKSLNSENNEIVHFLVNGKTVEFATRISPSVVEEYKNFFKQLFYNPSKEEGFNRDITLLSTLKSKEDFVRLQRKLKYVSNPSSWLIDRMKRHSVTVFITAGVAGTISYIQKDPESEKEAVVKVEQTDSSKLEEYISIDDEDGNKAILKLEKNEKGEHFYRVIKVADTTK